MRRRPIVATVLICSLIALLAAGSVVMAQEQSSPIRGEPDLSADLPDDRLAPGEAGELAVQITNQGELDLGNPTDRSAVTTARSVRVSADEDDAPIDIRTGRQSVGSISEDQPGEAQFAVRVPEDAEPGEYDIDIKIRYAHTHEIFPRGGVENERSRSTTETVTVEIDDGPRFSIDTVDSDLQVGESGTITADVENVGNEAARDIDVALTPTSGSLNFGANERSAARVSELDPGENATVEYDVSVDSNAVAGGHSLDGEVRFTDTDGIRGTDDRASLSAGVFPEEDRDDFIVETETESITAGDSIPVSVEVTNNRNEPVTNVEGKLFANDPLDSNDDEAFVRSLEPGESATMTFGLDADSNAIEKTYPISMDFRYDDGDGDSRISDTYRVPIDVAPGEDGGLPLGLIGAALGLTVLVGGAYIGYRRREL